MLTERSEVDGGSRRQLAVCAARIAGSLDRMDAGRPTRDGRVRELDAHVIRNVALALAEAPEVVTALTTTE
jgi:hypothetical protein